MAVVLSEQQLAALRSVDTPTLCNAIEAFKVRDQTYGFTGVDVRCLFPELGVMVGYAVTARVSSTEPGAPEQHDGQLALWEALQAAPKPAVLVFEDIGPRTRHSAHFGEMMGNTAKRLGAIGLVTDGGVRDLNEVRGLGFHYFALGATPSHGNPRIFHVGGPVYVDGCRFQMGDIVHGDLNGVTVVPAAVADRVMDEVARVREREGGMLEDMKDPGWGIENLRRRYLRH
ncbi:MAG TPA: RraA family protein [Chloroflexota bacterium]|nr:RraA family protein [Chloroflexota bacterium]